MAYNKNLDRVYFSKSKVIDRRRITVKVASCRSGPRKLQISCELLTNNGNYVFAKLGRLLKQEASELFLLLEEASQHLSEAVVYDRDSIGFDVVIDNKALKEVLVSRDIFSVRTHKRLKEIGLNTIDDVLRCRKTRLMAINGFGVKSLNEIKNVIVNLDNQISQKGLTNLDLQSDLIIFEDKESLGSKLNIFNRETLDVDISRGVFSVRTTNCLRDEEIRTVKELLEYSPERLMSIKYFGKKCLNEVVSIISKLDHQLKVSKSRQPEFSRELNAFDVLRSLIKAICPRLKFDNMEIGCLFTDDVDDFELKEIIDYFKSNDYCIDFWSDGKKKLFFKMLDGLKNRDFVIYKSRMGCGRDVITLEQIAHKFGITRERVRQISKKINKKINSYFFKSVIKHYFDKYFDYLNANGGLLSLDDFIRHIFEKDRLIDRESLTFIVGAYKCILQKELSLVTIDEKEYISVFSKELIDRAYNELIDESENLLGLTKDQIREFLKLDETYSQEVEDLCINIFVNNEGIFVDDNLVGIKKKQILNLEYLIREYKKGLHHTQITEAFSKRFYNGEHQTKIRGYFDRSENIILWDRGSFIHRDNIDVRFDEMQKIYNKIESAIRNLNNKTSVMHIFNDNRSLMEYLNIPTPYALYSSLRLHGDDRFIYRRYPDIEHIENIGEERKKLSEEIEDYFLQFNDELFWDQIKTYFIDKRGLLDYQIANTIRNSLKIYRVGSGRWIHRGILDLSDDKISKIVKAAKEEVKKSRYILMKDLVRTISLPDISPYHWSRTLLSSVIRKNSDCNLISNVAVISSRCDNIKTIDDFTSDILRNSNIKFTAHSLEVYLRRNKISSNMNFINEFIRVQIRN